jgi:hypothetical protein
MNCVLEALGFGSWIYVDVSVDPGMIREALCKAQLLSGLVLVMIL